MTDETRFVTTEDIVLMDRGFDEAAAPGRDLLIRLASYGEVANTPQGKETFARGVFADVDPSKVAIESQRHQGEIVGKGQAIEDGPDGIYLRAHISETSAGDDLLTLIKDRVLRGASVVFRPLSTNRLPGGVLERTKAELHRVAVLHKGAYPSATVLEVREEIMPEPEAVPTPEFDPAPLLARVDAQDETLRTMQAAQAAVGPYAVEKPYAALERFDTFGDAFVVAMENEEVHTALQRALIDQVTTGNEGLIDPSNNIPRIVLPVIRPRTSVNAFGTPIPLPPNGMTVTWPSFDPASDFVVAEQLTEKAEVSSGTVLHEQMSRPVRTFAGAVDVSLQLLLRSDPAYRELLFREMGRQWGLATNAAMLAILEASTTTDTLTLDGADDAVDAALLRAKLVAQSIAIEAESGVPANVVLASSTVFQRIAENGVLADSAYPVQNVAGTASAATLRVNVSGLTIVHDAQITAGDMITSESGAAGWLEDGPRTLQQDQVSKLGEDHAIYSFGNGAIFREAAVIVTTVTLI